MTIDIKKIDIKNIQFIEKDEWEGSLSYYGAKNILCNIKSVHLLKNKFHMHTN